MKQKQLSIAGVPAILLGERTDKIFLFVHGQSGSKEEAVAFAKRAVPQGWQVLGIDLPEHGGRTDGKPLLPWIAAPEIASVHEYLQDRWPHIALRANSIGAWFSLLALQDCRMENSLLVSPILDMEQLICSMMQWANVTEPQLQTAEEIETNFGQTLSWQYLCYARVHKVKALPGQTHILYAGQDNMTPRTVVDDFAKENHCTLTVMEDGEHWFHTEKQLAVLASWEEKCL